VDDVKKDYGMKKVGIIIPFYGGSSYLERLISSMDLDNEIYNKKLFIIDNSLPDEKIDRSKFDNNSQIEIIDVGVGLGFGKACNIGFNKCKEDNCEFIIVVNQDGYFASNSINLMIDTLEKHLDISVAVPVLKELNSDRIESFFTHVYLTPLTDFVSDLLTNEVKSFYQINNLCGACFIMRVSDYNYFDYLFDPLFHMYFEDEDLCLRLKRMNRKLIIIPQAVFHHFHSNTNNYSKESISGLITRFRSRQIFQLKNKKKITFKVFFGFLLLELNRTLEYLLHLEFKLMFVQLMSTISVIVNIPKVRKNMKKQELILSK